jgi:hypothetical protein
MLDPYLAKTDELVGEVIASNVWAEVIDLSSREFVSISDENLIGMGGYARLFTDWPPAEIETPILMLRATEPLAPGVDEEPRLPAGFPTPETVVEIEADHFSILQDGAHAAARTTENWLHERTQKS